MSQRLIRPAALALAVGLVAALAGRGGAAGAARPDPDRPNVILFVTDDQSYGSVAKMPFVGHAFRRWVAFPHVYVNSALCCPSRATLLSGQYSHHTGVEENSTAEAFDDTTSLATWLDAAGYRTGLFGKYLNHYPWDRGAGYVPPGWDEWTAFWNTAGRYYRYGISVNGAVTRRGTGFADYATTYFGDRALGFVDDSLRRDRPFFLYFAPFGPHPPRIPAPADVGAFMPRAVTLRANVSERRLADKPAWLQSYAYRNHRPRHSLRAALARAYSTALSEDRVMRRLVGRLRRARALDDTVIVFVSDNGFSFGSHGWWGKLCMYEECNHVPLLVFDPTAEPGVNRSWVSNVDVAPTIAAYAGTTPTHALDGRSLVASIRGGAPLRHRAILLRSANAERDYIPSGWGVRTPRWSFLVDERSELYPRERELYDIRADPYQLRNLLAPGPRRAGEPSRAKARRLARRLGARLRRLRG